MTKIAIIQRPSVLLDRDATIALAARWVAEAAAEGASLIVLPESFIPGYPFWIWKLAAGKDSVLMGELHTRLMEQAVDTGSGDLAGLCEAAQTHNVTIVCGIDERDRAHGAGTLFNTVVVIGADGKVQNRHRKLMPTNAERMVHGFGDASGLQVVDTPVGRLGTLICWENYMPLARYALYSQGVEIYVAPPTTVATAGSAPCATSRSKAGAGSSAAARCCAGVICQTTFLDVRRSFPIPKNGSMTATRWWSIPRESWWLARYAGRRASCMPKSTSRAWRQRAAPWTSPGITGARTFSNCR